MEVAETAGWGVGLDVVLHGRAVERPAHPVRLIVPGAPGTPCAAAKRSMSDWINLLGGAVRQTKSRRSFRVAKRDRLVARGGRPN